MFLSKRLKCQMLEDLKSPGLNIAVTNIYFSCHSVVACVESHLNISYGGVLCIPHSGALLSNNPVKICHLLHSMNYLMSNPLILKLQSRTRV